MASNTDFTFVSLDTIAPWNAGGSSPRQHPGVHNAHSHQQAHQPTHLTHHGSMPHLALPGSITAADIAVRAASSSQLCSSPRTSQPQGNLQPVQGSSFKGAHPPLSTSTRAAPTGHAPASHQQQHHHHHHHHDTPAASGQISGTKACSPSSSARSSPSHSRHASPTHQHQQPSMCGDAAGITSEVSLQGQGVHAESSFHVSVVSTRNVEGSSPTAHNQHSPPRQQPLQHQHQPQQHLQQQSTQRHNVQLLPYKAKGPYLKQVVAHVRQVVITILVGFEPCYLWLTMHNVHHTSPSSKIGDNQTSCAT